MKRMSKNLLIGGAAILGGLGGAYILNKIDKDCNDYEDLDDDYTDLREEVIFDDLNEDVIKESTVVINDEDIEFDK